MVEAYTQLREQERPEVDPNEVDYNPEARSGDTQLLTNHIFRGRAEELSELMAEGLRYGRTTAMQSGLYPYDEDTRQSDIPRDDIIAHANEWLVQESEFDYQTLESVMNAASLQDAVDWAWEQLDGPSYQFNLATFLSGGNAFNPVGDIFTGDFEWGRTPDRLKEFRPNPYADQSLGERTGIRNWGDAVYAILDVIDMAALGMGGEVVRPIWNALKKTDDPLRAWGQVVEAYRPRPISQLADPPGGVARAEMQRFLGDARLAPTRNIGEGVTVSEVAATQTDLSSLGQIGGPTPDARPFVVVRKADGSLQPFYQSTGDWSGMAGAWLPFDGFGGVVNDAFHRSWYRKNRFGQGEFARGTPLHRFGSEENKTLSELLGRELGDAEPTILFDMEGVDTKSFPGMSYEDLNEALGTYSDYGDYLAATVDESSTFTGNPMRVETPAGPTVIDLDAPQPDLPPGTALGPDGEVIRIMGLEDEAADAAARAEMQAAREAAQEGLPGTPTGRVGASGFAIDELPEGTAASLGKQKWTLDAHNSLSGSPEAVVFDEDTFEIVGYGPLGESFKGPAHIQSRLTDPDYMPDPIRVVMLRAKRSGPGWQEGDYISVQVGYLRETGAPKLGLSDEFGIGGADIPDDIAKEVWDQTWEGFDIGSAERIGGGVGLDPQRGTQPWGNIWTHEQDPLSSPSWPQYRNMGVTEAHWIEDQAAQHWTFTQEFIDREYPIVQRYRELQGIDDALEGLPGTPEAYLDQIRSDPESFYGTRGLTQAQIDGGMRASSADLDEMSWEQMFDLMRNASDPIYEHIEEEFMRRYNFLYGLKDQFPDHPQLNEFLRVFPEMTYPPETFGDMIAFAVDPDLGTFGSDQADFITKIAREIDEWWGEFRGGLVKGPPGTPESYTPDEIDQIVRNNGPTDKELAEATGIPEGVTDETPEAPNPLDDPDVKDAIDRMVEQMEQGWSGGADFTDSLSDDSPWRPENRPDLPDEATLADLKEGADIPVLDNISPSSQSLLMGQERAALAPHPDETARQWWDRLSLRQQRAVMSETDEFGLGAVDTRGFESHGFGEGLGVDHRAEGADPTRREGYWLGDTKMDEPFTTSYIGIWDGPPLPRSWGADYADVIEWEYLWRVQPELGSDSPVVRGSFDAPYPSAISDLYGHEEMPPLDPETGRSLVNKSQPKSDYPPMERVDNSARTRTSFAYNKAERQPVQGPGSEYQWSSNANTGLHDVSDLHLAQILGDINIASIEGDASEALGQTAYHELAYRGYDVKSLGVEGTFDERAVFDLIGVDIDDIADKARLVKESRTVAQNMADRATRGMAEAEQYDLAENMFENMQDPSIVGDDQLEDLFRLFSDD